MNNAVDHVELLRGWTTLKQRRGVDHLNLVIIWDMLFLTQQPVDSVQLSLQTFFPSGKKSVCAWGAAV